MTGDKAKLTPPEGYELVESGPFLEGDMFWMGGIQKWELSTSYWKEEPPALIENSGGKYAARPIQNRKQTIFGEALIMPSVNDKPKTSGDVW